MLFWSEERLLRHFELYLNYIYLAYFLLIKHWSVPLVVTLETMCLSSCETGQNEWNNPFFIKRGAELDNGWMLAELEVDIAPSFGHFSPLGASILPPLRDGEGTASRSADCSGKLLKWALSVTKSHHGSISVSTLCWIIAGFLLDLCYVWVWAVGSVKLNRN